MILNIICLKMFAQNIDFFCRNINVVKPRGICKSVYWGSSIQFCLNKFLNIVVFKIKNDNRSNYVEHIREWLWTKTFALGKN